ncbi:hypothetical protein GUJ93_ZPchr0458g22866, partial [Zizania palustris]
FGIEDTQTWKSLGRRVFDIYVQGERKEHNFDIRKTAGNKSYAVVRKLYNVSKRRKLSLEQQELYCIVGRPNVFSYGELRSATENFSSRNLLGQGGYGAVFKGKLTDGRAWELYESNNALGMVDPKLTEFNEEEVLRAIDVALVCTQGSPHQRPPMSRVVSMLTGDVEVAELVTKPTYISEWQMKGGNTTGFVSSISAVEGQSSSSPFGSSAVPEPEGR